MYLHKIWMANLTIKIKNVFVILTAGTIKEVNIFVSWVNTKTRYFFDLWALQRHKEANFNLEDNFNGINMLKIMVPSISH